jgi:hypothetical protein
MQVICDAIGNPAATQLRRDFESSGTRFGKRLSIYWQPVCDPIVNLEPTDLRRDCQSTGKRSAR